MYGLNKRIVSLGRRIRTVGVSVLVTRAADGVLTYAITPDLSKGVNPLSSVLGWGWVGLIVVAAVIVSGILWLNYLSLTRPCDNFPASPRVDWPTFRKEYFNIRGSAIFAQRPWWVFVYVCGYVFPRAVIAWSLLLLVHNWFVYTDVAWYRPIRAYRLSFVIYMALPLLVFFFGNQLQRSDYARYLQLHTANKLQAN